MGCVGEGGGGGRENIGIIYSTCNIATCVGKRDRTLQNLVHAKEISFLKACLNEGLRVSDPGDPTLSVSCTQPTLAQSLASHLPNPQVS